MGPRGFQKSRVNPRAPAMTLTRVVKRWEILGCQMGHGLKEHGDP